MPTRLAVVTARRLHRCRSRVLVGLLAALVATLAPVESPVPLGPLEGLAGSAPAEAQSAIVPGSPDPCPTHLQPNADGSLCVRTRSACPEHPYQTGSYLQPSTDFPDFCEETVWLSADPTSYQDCTTLLTGYVIKQVVRGGDQGCRMIRPTQCAQNMHRTGVNTCEQVQRRTWSCPTGTPTNRFNDCYQQPADYVPPHPACVAGAPDFAISSCVDYVSQDFERAPAPGQCGNFDTGGSPRLRNAGNPHWCEFDAEYLDVDCHGSSATCATATSTAFCIMRASATGGCSAIANTLRCRDLQAGYRDGSRTAEYVYLQGCTPCVVLPFSPTPTGCPPDLWANPRLSGEPRLESTHQRRSDSRPISWSPSRCTDPPRGRLVWESSHHAGFAIVNSPVILRVTDIPITARRHEYISVSFRPPPHNDVRFLPFRGHTSQRYFEYADSAPGDPIVRTWPTFDDTLRFTEVDRIVGAARVRPGSSNFYNTGPCLIREPPDFRVRVEELWPDSDASDITALFGSDALNWWPTDQALQRERTEARGLNYVGHLTATHPDRVAELARRANELTQVVRCNYSTDVWCNWRPTRPGYYRLVAAGAWYLDKLGRNRGWLQTSSMTRLDNALAAMYNDPANRDGDCIRDPGDPSYSDYDCLKEDLDAISDLSYSQAGLLPDLSGLITVTQTDEWLYTPAAGPDVRCPPRDMRVDCAGGRESSNYTETEPIGILVHEVRVSTVAPDR